MSRLSPPFRPSFGAGAPGANVPKNQPYFNTSTTPYTPYVWNGSAWVSYGVSGGTGDATEIQGVPVSAVAPTNGQTLIYDSVNNLWKPGSVSASTPTIVQVGFTNDLSGTVTMPSAPTQGNLLIAIVENNSSSTVNNTGWNQVASGTGSADGFGYGWKIAGASEPTTQTPSTQTGTAGAVVIFEIAGAGNPGIWATTSNSSTTSLATNIQTFIAKQLVVGLFLARNITVTLGVTGADTVVTNTGTTRTLAYYSGVVNSVGVKTFTGTSTANVTCRNGCVIVGP